MANPPRDFIMEEVKSLRTELQERNRDLGRLVLSAMGGSFLLLAFAFKDICDKATGGISWCVICAALPAIAMPILTLWFWSEDYSARRIALFIRRVSEPALASPKEPSDTMSWEQFTGRWDELKDGVKNCKSCIDADGCKQFGRRKIEWKLWANPKSLTLQVMMILSLTTAFLAAFRTSLRESWPTLVLVLAVCVVTFLLTRFRSVYLSQREIRRIETILPRCAPWDEIYKKFLDAKKQTERPQEQELGNKGEPKPAPSPG